MKDVQPKTAIIYCRVSHSEQVEGTSLDTQQRLCAEYAERLNLVILETFIERGESAKTADRTELNRAIQYCTLKSGRVGFFIVHKLDRFARNQEDHVGIRALLRKAGTQLLSVTEPIDASPVGRALEGILSVFAEFDNNVRSERTTQGMRERLRQGFWVFHPPVGYLRRSPKETIIPDPEQAPYIRLLFREYAKGTYTYDSLTRFLSERGFRPNGRRPYNQLIAKILRSPLYCGIMEAWGERYPGNFEPLISQALFQRCQPAAATIRPLTNPRYTNNPLFPLRSFIVCARCRAPLTGSSCRSGSGARHPYYHHGKARCAGAGFHPKARVEQQFVDVLRGVGLSDEYVAALRETAVRYWKDRLEGIDPEEVQLQKQIKVLEKDRDEVFAAHRRRVYSDEEFTRERDLIDQRINEKRLLLSEKTQHRTDGFDLNRAVNLTIGMVRNPADTWQKLEDSFLDRLAFQKRLFQQRLRYDRTDFLPVGTGDLSLIYRLSGSFPSHVSALGSSLGEHWNEFLGELREWTEFYESLEEHGFRLTAGKGGEMQLEGPDHSPGEAP